MSTNKELASAIYNKHLALASTDGRLFRKTVMDEIMVACECRLAASATLYNNCKKGSAPIEGLGRAPVPAGIRRPGAKGKEADDLQSDNDCFTVLELESEDRVARMQSFHMQGDASESFDSRVANYPDCQWVMIRGLGPNSGDKFELEAGEEEIKRYQKLSLSIA